MWPGTYLFRDKCLQRRLFPDVHSKWGGICRNTGMNAFRVEENVSSELEVGPDASSGIARLSKWNQKSSPS